MKSRRSPNRRLSPLLSIGWLGWQVPLRRPAAAPEPGEDHAENLSGLIYFQFRGSRCRGIRSRNALAGRIVLKSVKRTHEATIAYLATDLRPQVRTQMWAYRVGHADTACIVAPHDDFFAQPRLLDQFLSQYGFATCDEIPPLGERR